MTTWAELSEEIGIEKTIRTMVELGINEVEARFILDIELGNIDSDVVLTNNAGGEGNQ